MASTCFALPSPLLSLPSLTLLCPRFVAVAFAFMRLTNRQTIWRPGTSLQAPCAPLFCLLSLLLSLLFSPAFYLFARLSIISHCPLPPIDVRHFVVSSPKNICLPFYRCWFAWQLWQRQIALLAKLRSGYARPEKGRERGRVGVESGRARQC